MQINQISVVGAGMMGHVIAQEFASSGYRVTSWGRSAKKLRQAELNIQRNLREPTHRGVFDEVQIQATLAGIKTTPDLQKAGADVACGDCAGAKDFC